MIEIIIILAILTGLFWIAYRITGVLLSAVIWVCIKLPIAIVIACIGLLCCITVLLMPVGLKCFGLAGKVLLG